MAGLLILWAGVSVVLHLFFALGVYSSAKTLQRCGEQVWFAPPVIWALATLAAGLFAGAVYWLIHHSQLRAPRRDELS